MWMVYNLSIQGLIGLGVISAFPPSQPSLQRLPPTKMVLSLGAGELAQQVEVPAANQNDWSLIPGTRIHGTKEQTH